MKAWNNDDDREIKCGIKGKRKERRRRSRGKRKERREARRKWEMKGGNSVKRNGIELRVSIKRGRKGRERREGEIEKMMKSEGT